ncbi:MAG: excinuclease ABC subunit UvrB [Dehalococcoidales bacterium]|jgi:excinuclease ABC subunit B|nr:excinuclease ABC subunit UvrB [Dehalococcoidales bacterium]MDD4322682.1 excinuclease ABC subunit UvrB [Dehalococcoidales bacterium]MDD4794300.1 excinuclease ABC subunit UvrB [Dehalococcoidales bacterium]MDD5122107.1 excinuclease ABC subunit UvrB [Dehalococcoidales bacterium]MDD5498551.1 excinuclease ABC subunit UvrB [Dehalococcoidales bacterium]
MTDTAEFSIYADFKPTGDQPQAIDRLVEGIEKGYAHQTLLGVTGSGKTFTLANTIARSGKPALIISHNKTLAAQLYSEFKEFLPNNAVEYFVSYYDYYQPEAYLPQTDTYIDKETDINDEIDKLRHAATKALLSRRDVVIVASVSCIYGLGEPEEYKSFIVSLKKGGSYSMDRLFRQFVDQQYERNDFDFSRGHFRVRGDTVEILPAYEDTALRLEFFGDELERIIRLDPLTGEFLAELEEIDIYPAKHFVTSPERMTQAMESIRGELEQRLGQLEAQGRLLEAARLKARTNYDLEMLAEVGYCSGIENYSRHLTRRPPGSAPYTLIDYFPKDFLLIIDESHMTIPQIRGMYNGDRARKEVLVEYGFRLPSALDNRPLDFSEFNRHINQAIYVSATPKPYELGISQQVVEQLVRPTGLIEPTIEVKPTHGQIDDLVGEVRKRVERGERCLITTLTKKLAEQLSEYLIEMGIKTNYLHSEVDTLERVEILRDLRLGVYDVLVGINLLREGLDLPEVSLVAILDADKEGFLRSEESLVQTMGRAARHIDGHVIMYADTITGSMERAMAETMRRRKIQEDYNLEHGINPQSIRKAIKDITERVKSAALSQEKGEEGRPATREEIARLIRDLEKQMKASAKNLEYEKAALLRDRIIELRVAMESKETLSRTRKVK